MEVHNELMHCPNCRKNYSITGNLSNTRLPILLKCSHSICDYCFKNEIKGRREVMCRRCSVISKMTINQKGKDNFDEFPVHYYIAGILVQEKLNMIRDHNETDLTFKVDKNTIGKKNCDKCGIKEAQVKCDQCEDSFCNGCDKVIHNITTGSKKHDRKRISSIPLPIAMIDNKPTLCTSHNLELSYNCYDCKQILCSECILQSHKDHSYESIKDKHKFALEETHELLDKVQEIIPRFSYSQSKIHEVCTKIETKVQTCQKTSKAFEHIFGSIQKCEFDNRIKIRDFFIDQVNNLRKFMDELTKRINDVKEFIRIKTALNDISIEVYKVNLNEINAALNDILATPWYIKKDMIDSIEKYEFENCEMEKFDDVIKLQLNDFPKIELLKIDQVPIDELKEIDLAISKSEHAYKFRGRDNKDLDNCSVISFASTNSNMSKIIRNDGFDHRKGFNRRSQKVLYSPDTGRRSTVIICHMISPASFYVHLTKNREIFKYFNSLCEKWSLQAHVVMDVKKNQVFLTPVLNDVGLKEWRRVQVKEILDSKKCSVQFIDYGAITVVSIDNLKVISDKIKKFLPFAFHCRLNESFPIQANWTSQDTREVLNMLKTYKSMQIYVHRKIEDVYIVDLCLFSEKLGSRILSLQEVLLALKKASMYNYQSEHSDKVVDLTEEDEITINNNTNVTNEISNKSRKKFISDIIESTENISTTKNVNDLIRIEVSILKCENPDNILISLPNRLIELNELSKKMQDYYGNEKNLIPLKKEDIKMEAVCLAFSNAYNKWSRGNICDYSPEVEKVKVYFFDDGVEEDFPINVVYELNKEFLISYSGVIKGFLAGIHPPCRKDTWPRKTCERLAELVDKKKIFMTKIGSTVDKAIPLDFSFEDCVELDALKPSIFKWKSVREILIQEGLACVDSQFKNSINETKDDVMNELNMHFASISDSKKIIDENINDDNSTTLAQWLPPNQINEKIFFGKPKSVDMQAFVYIFNLNEGSGIYTKIRNVLNTLLKDSKPNMSRIWKKGDICSAKFFADNEYHRAEIAGIDDDGKYLVQFIDYGNIEICSATDLREQYFLHDIPKQVHKCRVKGLNDLLKPFENNETFLKEVLDYTHVMVVEKQVSIELLNYDEDGYPVVDICVNGDQLLNLVNDEIDRLRNIDDRQYQLLEYDKTCLSVDVLVTDILSANEVILVFHKNYTEFESAYEKMINHMKFQAKNQPKITDFSPDRVCIAFDTQSSTWHRGRIYTRIDPYTNLVNVYFVDLGYISNISMDLIRDIRDEWLKIPVKSYICKLVGLKDAVLLTNHQQSESINNLRQCLPLNEEYRAVIKGTADGVLKCDLYDKESQKSVYSQLQ